MEGVATAFEVCDELWEAVEPLIPPVSMSAKQGRRPVPGEVWFNAIVFVLVTGTVTGPRFGALLPLPWVAVIGVER